MCACVCVNDDDGISADCEDELTHYMLSSIQNNLVVCAFKSILCKKLFSTHLFICSGLKSAMLNCAIVYINQ